MERKFNDQELARRAKLEQLIKNKQNPYEINSFKRTDNALTIHEKYDSFSKEKLHEKTINVAFAGRLLAMRQTFGVLKDGYGRIQTYINKKEQPEVFQTFSELHIGDIIGVEGSLMKTNTGELTIKILKLTLLSKSLKPLPEKWHGLVDEELRARNRYLDLIMSDDSLKTFILRSRIIKYLRAFMQLNNFIEVETPILQPYLGGAAARPFTTHHNALDRNYYLRIATELPLKKLIVGGYDRVFEIGRQFRNEGMDATHNPEFTTIEAYQSYASMYEIMEWTEDLFKFLAGALKMDTIQYKGSTIDFTKPFRRIKMLDLIKEVCGVDFNLLPHTGQCLAVAKQHGIKLEPYMLKRGHIISAFFETFCEAKCIQPTIVYEYPIEISPLAKKNKDDPRMTERFELFICGKEIANAFSELNDPIDQLERLKNQIEEKALGNQEACEIDWDFINALEYGMPPTGGIGIGIDRLVMLFTNQTTIRNVLLFPHMRENNE